MKMTEREAFEYWADAKCYYLDKREDGGYEKGSTALAWEIAQYFMAVGRAQAVPDTHLLVEKKNTEDWYLDDDEYLWLDHDGIDGTLCELSIGEVKPVQHKEYLITQSNTLYAARVWDDNDDHIAWKLFDSQETALDAANHCKQMYEASESGAEQ
ncbi:hypothetical protein [Acinetobacter sp. Leaf130]|uniref:hypothetical protein n=1 Tax=Acinetobacter sp. Leaf130 TaxID=1736269 RepID=UPI0006F8A73A|nr:hypothetical protein [Acinetobacter sp. Leaf130]KQQ77275.1 hypothetical protein ASF86_07150 [Acinetobacter sp. Leaf130]